MGRNRARRQKSIDEQIADNRASQARETARLRAQDHLTDDHKRREMGRIHEHYARRHEDLLAQQRAARAQRKEQLEKKIFSPASQNRASYRQALEQAGRTEREHELRALYNQAIVTNDSDLQQAAVYHAAQRGLYGIVDDYGQRNPGAAQALAEYASPEVNPSDRELFRERLLRAKPQKPQEIRRNSYDA